MSAVKMDSIYEQKQKMAAIKAVEIMLESAL
jgi:hypothetical protein